jgi:hypothetical protein
VPGQNLYFMFNAISMSVETVHCQQVSFSFQALLLSHVI